MESKEPHGDAACPEVVQSLCEQFADGLCSSAATTGDGCASCSALFKVSAAASCRGLALSVRLPDKQRSLQKSPAGSQEKVRRTMLEKIYVN